MLLIQSEEMGSIYKIQNIWNDIIVTIYNCSKQNSIKCGLVTYNEWSSVLHLK